MPQIAVLTGDIVESSSLSTAAPGGAEAAKRPGIPRQAVNQALWSAGFPALEEALGYLEAAF